MIDSEDIKYYLDENGNVKEEFSKVKKVFLKDLPKCLNRDAIDWMLTAKEKRDVEFIYNGVYSNAKIKGYTKINKGSIVVKIRGKESCIRTYEFAKCKIGSILGTRKSEYIYEVGSIISRENGGGSLRILEQTRIRDKNTNRKAYKFLCNKCSHIDVILENSIRRGRGCGVCCSFIQKVIKDKNSIYKTHPHLAKYFLYESDKNTHTAHSNKKVDMMCPNCKKISKKLVSNLYAQGFSCECGDKKPYPEKFIREMLLSLQFDFKCEKTFSWSKRKRYDFYIPSLNCVIETHGVQHYKGGFESIGGRNLEEEQENDKYKRELALSNGIEHYIELDCRKSELEWIKNSVLNSKLTELFDLSNIDWLECERNSLKNEAIKICEYWNVVRSSKLTCLKFNIDKTTLRNYLIKGNSMGLCEYNNKIANDVRINNVLIELKKKSKRIINIETGDVFNSLSEVEETSEVIYGMKLFKYGVSACCNGKRARYKGLSFEYID